MSKHYKRYIGKKYAVHCKTQEEWVRVRKSLNYEGYEYEDLAKKYPYVLTIKGDYYLDCHNKDVCKDNYTIITPEEFFGGKPSEKVSTPSEAKGFDPNKSFCIHDFQNDEEREEVVSILENKGLEFIPNKYGGDKHKELKTCGYIRDVCADNKFYPNPEKDYGSNVFHYSAPASEFIRDYGTNHLEEGLDRSETAYERQNRMAKEAGDGISNSRRLGKSSFAEELFEREYGNKVVITDTPKDYWGSVPYKVGVDFGGEEDRTAWYLQDAYKQRVLGTWPQDNKSLTNKIMNGVVKFAKDLTLSADEKELRKAGLKNSEGGWTKEAFEIAINLQAQDFGYKNAREMVQVNDFDGEMDVTDTSPIEAHNLFKQYEDKLLETAKKYNKEQSKK